MAKRIARRVTLKQKIMGLHLAHPDWPSGRIARALHISQNRVTMYASSYKFKLPTTQAKQFETDDVRLARAREYLAQRPPAALAYLGISVPEAAE